MKPLRARHLISAILICCLCMAGCTNSDKKEAQGYIKKARDYMAQKKPEMAVVEFRNAVQLDPNNDVALFELAEAYVLTRQVNKATRYYNLAAKANPQNIMPHLRLAQIYMQTGQLLEAREYVSKVLDIAPLSVAAHHILAGIMVKERDLESAIETLNKTASIDPKNIRTYTSLAQLYIKTGAVDKAANAYMAALSADPSARDAYMGLARIYAYEREWDKVESLLKGTLEADGNKLLKYTDLAKFYENRRQFDLAEENYQNAMMEGPDRIEPLLNLSQFYTRQKNLDKAVLMVKNALAKQKRSPLLYSALAQVYTHFNMIPEAEDAVKKALSIDNNYIDALFQQGRILMLKKDFKKALDKFDQVLAIDRIHAEAYYYRALCIEQRGATDRPEQKIFRAAAGMLNNPEEFEKDQIKGNLLAAIAVDPGLVDARLDLAEIYILEKNLVKAKEQLEEVFKISQPGIRVMTLMSGISLLEGDVKEAEKILKTILKERPEYAPAHIRLGMLYRSMGRPDQALECIKTAHKLQPDQTGLVRMMTEIFMAEKKFKEAIDLVNGYMSDGPEGLKRDLTPFYENLKGEIYLKSGEHSTALEHFKMAVEKMPDFISPHMHIAAYYKQKGQFHKALAEYQVVEKSQPSYLPAIMAMAVLYDRLENYAMAVVYYRKVLSLSPKHPDAANNLAYILSEDEKSVDEAFELAKIARQQKAKDPNVLDTMGWLYYQKGNYLNARSELQESLKLNPDSPLTCFHYGMTLYRNQEFEKARQFFKKALDLDPGFRDADKARKMLN